MFNKLFNKEVESNKSKEESSLPNEKITERLLPSEEDLEKENKNSIINRFKVYNNKIVFQVKNETLMQNIDEIDMSITKFKEENIETDLEASLYQKGYNYVFRFTNFFKYVYYKKENADKDLFEILDLIKNYKK